MTTILKQKPLSKELKTEISKARSVAEALTEVLTDTYRLVLKSHTYHWNVTGQEFRGIHLFLDEITDQVRLWYDDVAERLATLSADGVI